MAINKESTGFTFGFAIVLVIILGVILASLAEGLKPMKEKNVRVKKQIDILSAMMDVEEANIDRSNAETEFSKYVKLEEAVVLNKDGKRLAKENQHLKLISKKNFATKRWKKRTRNFHSSLQKIKKELHVL